MIPSKVAWSIGERCGLQRWASLVSGVAPGLGMGSTAGSKMSTASIRTKVTDENTKRELLKVLLRVYMSGGCGTSLTIYEALLKLNETFQGIDNEPDGTSPQCSSGES